MDSPRKFSTENKIACSTEKMQLKFSFLHLFTIFRKSGFIYYFSFHEYICGKEKSATICAFVCATDEIQMPIAGLHFWLKTPEESHWIGSEQRMLFLRPSGKSILFKHSPCKISNTSDESGIWLSGNFFYTYQQTQ